MILKNQILYRTGQKPIVWDAFFKNEGNPKPLVIFCHGYKGFKDWGSWNLVAENFSQEDFFFVKFNFSHNGGTTDQPIDFPDLEAFAQNNYTKELDDLEHILHHILSDNFKYRTDIDLNDITLIGHSRGGGIAIIKTFEDHRIKRLITWASISDFGKRTATTGDLDVWKRDGVKYVLNGRTQQQMPHYFQFYENYKANEERLNIKNALQKTHKPILIIHAKDDPSVAFSEAEDLHSWNVDTQLLMIENSNHVFDASHPWIGNALPKALETVVKKSISFIKS